MIDFHGAGHINHGRILWTYNFLHFMLSKFILRNTCSAWSIRHNKKFCGHFVDSLIVRKISIIKTNEPFT